VSPRSRSDSVPATASGPRRTYGQQSLTERREDQYRRLIEAARDGFAEHGYAGTSIEDIVARARVSRTSFYRFFSDREDCLLAVYREGTERGLAALKRTARSHPPAEQKVRAGIAGFLETLAADLALAHVVLIDIVGATPAAEQARVEVRRRIATVVEEELKESGLWQGRPEIEIHLVALATMAGIAESVAYLVATGGLGDWRQAVEPLAAFAIRALTPPAGAGGA